MKKILILQIALLMALSACNFDNSSESEVDSEIVTAVSEETFETTQKTTVTKSEAKQTEATTSVAAISKAESLDLGETDQWSFNSSSKFIYFTDYGRYYSVEIGGRNSANYVLCLDKGDGEPEILTETEDYSSYYCDKNNIYIYKTDWLNNKAGIYKLENDSLTAIKEVSETDNINSIYPVYFTDNYIYYFQNNESNAAVYRMDYEGDNVENVANVSNDIKHSFNFAVCDNKIWYDYNYDQGLSYYDIETGETGNFDKGQTGIINNGYMYYTYYKESDKLMRFDLSSYEYEEVYVMEDGKSISEFDFYKDYILYSSDGSLYKMNDNENTLIFSTEDFFGSEGYYVWSIQCQDNRIFLKIGSGAFYQCIMEIDIDGNVIEVIHEDDPPRLSNR